MKADSNFEAFYLPRHIITNVHVMQERRDMYNDYVYRVYYGSKRIATFSGKYIAPIDAQEFIDSVMRNRNESPEMVAFRRDIKLSGSLLAATNLL